MLTGFIDNSKVYLQIALSESICQAFFQDSVCYHQMISKIFGRQYFQKVVDNRATQGTFQSLKEIKICHFYIPFLRLFLFS